MPKISLNIPDAHPIDGLCTIDYHDEPWPVYLMLDYPSGIIWLEQLDPAATPLDVRDGRRAMWRLAATPTATEGAQFLEGLKETLQAECTERGSFEEEIERACEEFISSMTFCRAGEFFEFGGEVWLDADGDEVDIWEGVQVEYSGHGTINAETSDDELGDLEIRILEASTSSCAVRLGQYLRDVRKSCSDNG